MARNSRLPKSRSSKSRPAKMGRKWTQDDVLAYKIKVVYQDLTTFFGVTDLPPPDVESEALTAQDFHTATDDWTNFMLFHMDRLMDPDDVTGTLSNRKKTRHHRLRQRTFQRTSLSECATEEIPDSPAKARLLGESRKFPTGGCMH
jgi:hypothetical protein